RTGSPLTYSATAPAPQSAASPGDQGQVLGERYSWSSPPSHAVASVPPGGGAAAPAYGPGQVPSGHPNGGQRGYHQPGPGQQGGVLTPYRREAGVAAPGGPSRPAGAALPSAGPAA